MIIAIEAVMFAVGDWKINQGIMLEEYRLEKAQTVLAAVPVEAKAFSVYDITAKKKLYGKNDEEPLPLASLAKIMTIIAVLNTHGPDDIVTMSDNALKQNGDYGFKPGEVWKVGDLAKATLIVSANDGAQALAESVPDFLDKITKKARKIGATHATFLNASGLDLDPSHASVFASAEDVNQMAAFAYDDYPGIFGTTVLPEIHVTSVSGFEHVFKNTDVILDKIPNLLFSKTGFTNVAGGNLTIIFKNQSGHEMAVTLLGSGFDSRFADMQKLVDAIDSL